MCEYNHNMKPGQDNLLRFVEHTRQKKSSHKGKLSTITCEGSYHTPEEAQEVRKTQHPSDPSQRPL